MTKKGSIRKKVSPLHLLRKPQYLMIMPSLIFLILIVVFPLVFLFRTSLYDLTFMNFRVGAPYIGLRNFIDLITVDTRFWTAIQNTFLFVALGVSGQFFLGLAMAIVFNRVLKHGSFISLLMFPSMVAPIVVGLLWRYILNSDFGIISQLLMMWGYSRQAWLADPSVAVYVLLLIDLWQWTPFMFLILLAGLQAMPQDVIEAAEMDGAGSVLRLFRIILPVIKPVVFVALSFRVMDAFKIFDIIAVLTGGGPGSATMTLSLKAMVDGFTYFRLSYASAVSVLMVILVTIFSSVFLRVLYKEMGTEA